jgi:hypothetical protein
MQRDPIVRSRRKALRGAQTWLLALARERNDPHARRVLNSASFFWGAENLREVNRTTGRSGHEERMRADRQPPGRSRSAVGTEP